MAIPDFQTLMLPVLRQSAAGEVRIGDVVERLADEFNLSDDDRAQLLPSGRQTTSANRVHWAKSYLGKAGLVEMTRRAHFKITDEGRRVLESPPPRIDIRFLSQFEPFAEFRRQSEEESGASDAAEVGASALTPDEIMRAASKRLEADLASDLLQRVRAGTPAFFESLVVRLLIAMGYGGSVTDVDKALVGKSGDGEAPALLAVDPPGGPRSVRMLEVHSAFEDVVVQAVCLLRHRRAVQLERLAEANNEKLLAREFGTAGGARDCEGSGLIESRTPSRRRSSSRSPSHKAR